MKKNVINDNKSGNIERQIYIKIFYSQHKSFTQLCLMNLFIKILFLLNQMIIETNIYIKLNE
jgi:Na+/H+ antiporter NhaA